PEFCAPRCQHALGCHRAIAREIRSAAGRADRDRHLPDQGARTAAGLRAAFLWRDQSGIAAHGGPAAASAEAGDTMKRVVTFALLAAAATASTGAAAQTAMLSPPDNHYFASQGSWGQKYPDQWALQRIGFDASPNSAWRLVKQNAQ